MMSLKNYLGIKPTIILVSFLLLTSGCIHSINRDSSSANSLLKEGLRMVKKKKWTEAQEVFNQVLEDFPDSKERSPALLYLADSYYSDLEYEEAKFSYLKFTELYPTHKQVTHAYYYKAMCDFKLIDIASRDQTYTINALEQFEELIKLFPDSSYTKKAESKRDECLSKQAENLMFIGKYYFRTGAFQSAIHRFNSLLTEFQGQKFNQEAMYLLAESYYKEQNYEKAGESYKNLLKRYPKGEFSKEARTRLRKLR